jgi:steroid 5-alpha reductase family enzyme
MSFFEIWGIGALIIWAYVTGAWIISVALKNASIVDVFWGMGFVVLAWTYYALADDGFVARKTLITALVSIWGGRLSLHILVRNWGKGEDYRYQQFRQQYGPERYWWFSYFQVFLLQGALIVIISAPLLAAHYYETPDRFTVLDGIGALVWLIGFIFEAGGDWQLMQFKRDPANVGKVLDSGLWAWTRHPNYFGDAAQWWGFWLIAASTGWGALTIFAPAIMNWLLVFVSGVAMLERNMRQKPKYDEYMQRTSAFFPRPPKPSRSME